MKNNSKKTLAIVTLAALLLTSFGKVGHATVVSGATGSTDVSVNLSGIVILHYISGITLNFDNLSGVGIDEGVGTWDVTWADGEASGTAGLTNSNLDSSASEPEDGKITVHIPNVWAVRGISSSGNAEVSVALTTPTITNTTSGSSATITITAAQVKHGSSTSNGSNPINVPLGGILKSQAEIGDVNLTLDMSSANATGTYTGGVYTITAEAV
ncbi:hypothetical protein CR164_01330 [Prosthecochloris marina]|uniref:Uncharacterized protein n=1 Tax=Prosthecochloris marina TaxID=2017681 RepID=A0A317T9Y2_9CHLB|nr:hypothetical protein [Prosthecochloris marina]PWW83230.1 hypothetical protein CR164_01330 [Prosthecochloris marina]